METWMGGPLKREPELRDRVVTLTVGQLTDAIAEALSVVQDAPLWEVGDRALIEVEVVATLGDRARVSFGAGSISIPVSMLEEIEE